MTPRVEAVARIISSWGWTYYDLAMAPYLENRGSIGDENYTYQKTWSKGLRTPEQVHEWLTNWPPKEDFVDGPHIELLESLEKARIILEKLENVQR